MRRSKVNLKWRCFRARSEKIEKPNTLQSRRQRDEARQEAMRQLGAAIPFPRSER